MDEDFIYDQYLVSQHQFFDTFYNSEKDKSDLKMSKILYNLWNSVEKVQKLTVVNPKSPLEEKTVISKEERYHSEGITETYLIINPQAFKIVEKAKMLGCSWAIEAEKELHKLKSKVQI